MISRLLHLVFRLTLCALLPAIALAQTGPQRPVTISVYQGECHDGDFDANLRTVRNVSQQARDRHSDFLIFPEAFLSGYDERDNVLRGARPLHDPQLQSFIKSTADHSMVLVVGLARVDSDKLFNTALVIQHGRLLGYYDKIMLTSGDRDSLGFSPGTAVPVFEAHGWRFAAIICHDSSFPHTALAARLQGAQLLFTPHYNTIALSQVDAHRRWVRNCHIGLATQLKMVVARSNTVRTGQIDPVSYGDSFVLNPQGEPIAEAGLSQATLITAPITPDLFEWPTVWADLDEVPAWLYEQVGAQLGDFRRPTSESNLGVWLNNMIHHHRFADHEIRAASGLTLDEIHAARAHLDPEPLNPRPALGKPIRILPYPGGRHPRGGFFEGALMPQRETKFSAFLPWDTVSYVVVDLPEAIWSNLGLTYLAHTHIDTLWTQQGIVLPKLEWTRAADGGLTSERALPNGIVFGASVLPNPSEIRMQLWLRNGTQESLSELRVQNCVHLKQAGGFAAQTLTNKVFQPPFAAVRHQNEDKWIVTAWSRIDRCWGSELVPCLHADPQFPDCPPGQTVTLRGWLSFYEGDDVDTEFERIRAANFLQTHSP